jgi:hypothetical protein
VLLALAGITEMVEREGAIPVIVSMTAERINVLRMALDDRSVPGRAVLINVSARLRRFHHALSEFYPQPEDHALDKRMAAKPIKGATAVNARQRSRAGK